MTTKSILVATQIAMGCWQGLADDLVAYYSFDSDAAITSPDIGSSGTRSEGILVAGKSNQALQINSGKIGAVFGFNEIKQCIDQGTIEFWFKINDEGESYSNLSPNFFRSYCGSSEFVRLELSANNGNGQHGLTGFTPHDGLAMSTGFSSSYPYTSVFPEGTTKDWHHVALIWNKDGISGLECKNAMMMVWWQKSACAMLPIIRSMKLRLSTARPRARLQVRTVSCGTQMPMA